MVRVSLDPNLRNREQREDWAVRKSLALTARRMDLEAGGKTVSGTTMQDAISQFYDGHPQLRPRTVETHRRGTDKLTTWAADINVRTVDDLNRAKLMKFREKLVNEKKLRPGPGSRGRMVKLKQSRSPHTINREMAGRISAGRCCDERVERF